MKRNIVFFQNEEEQACMVKFGKKKISATLCSGEHSCALKLVELEHSPTEKENTSDIQQLKDRTVYLDFSNADSIDAFVEWLAVLKLKFTENSDTNKRND